MYQLKACHDEIKNQRYSIKLNLAIESDSPIVLTTNNCVTIPVSPYFDVVFSLIPLGIYCFTIVWIAYTVFFLRESRSTW